MRFPLVGGSYQARSNIANAQRCINYYPEINRSDAPTPFTYYQRPGLKDRASGGSGPVRLLYRASNGNGYTVIGQNVYSIGSDWSLTLLGQVSSSEAMPCKAADNGQQILLVDGSTLGWTIDLATNAYAQVSDPTGIFTGADTVAYMDTYVLWNIPGTTAFGSTLSGSITFDATFFASKIAYPDNLQALLVNRHEILLFGSLKSEIWYDAGGATFPFAQLPGAYIEHGCAAKYSIASMDIETLWLGQDLQGNCVVFGLRGYDVRRVSNHALEGALQAMANVSDAIGFTLQVNGHYFYVLTFPSENQTWVYDASLEKDPTMAWHQWTWTDADGGLNRFRGMCCGFINGKVVVGDWENGTIYSLETSLYHDEVAGVSSPITCVKGFPHVLQIPGPSGQMVGTELRRVQYGKFIADIECGKAPLNSDGTPAQITMKYSVDRGETYGAALLQTIGAPGAYETVPTWQVQGMARDIVFELSHSIDGPAALNGCFVDVVQVGT